MTKKRSDFKQALRHLADADPDLACLGSQPASDKECEFPPFEDWEDDAECDPEFVLRSWNEFAETIHDHGDGSIHQVAPIEPTPVDRRRHVSLSAFVGLAATLTAVAVGLSAWNFLLQRRFDQAVFDRDTAISERTKATAELVDVQQRLADLGAGSKVRHEEEQAGLPNHRGLIDGLRHLELNPLHLTLVPSQWSSLPVHRAPLDHQATAGLDSSEASTTVTFTLKTAFDGNPDKLGVEIIDGDGTTIASERGLQLDKYRFGHFSLARASLSNPPFTILLFEGTAERKQIIHEYHLGEERR